MNNEKLKQETFTNSEVEKIVDLKRKAENILKNIDSDPCFVIAGGCFASWLNGQPPKDIDIFILNTHNSIHNSALQILKSKFYDLEDTTADYLRDNSNIDSIWMSRAFKYQFIFTKYKTREELIAHFDYVHCMVSYQPHQLYITRKTFDAIKEKHLIVNNKNQVQPWRRDKFIGRGWSEPGSDDALSVQAFNNLMRQPVNVGNWQSAARINPMRGSLNPYVDAVTKWHIDKLLEDLEKNGS